MEDNYEIACYLLSFVLATIAYPACYTIFKCYNIKLDYNYCKERMRFIVSTLILHIVLLMVFIFESGTFDSKSFYLPLHSSGCIE